MKIDKIINTLDPSKKECSALCGEYVQIHNTMLCDSCIMKFQKHCNKHSESKINSIDSYNK